MIYLLLGPSGSGKTTLASCLRDLNVPELISHTTREPRKGEVEGITYYYVSRLQFEAIPMIETTEYNGQLYGTSLAEINRVMKSNKDSFAIVDSVGVKQYRQAYGEQVKVIYVYAPASELIKRMEARGDNAEVIAQRIQHALATGEMDNLGIADYCIVNKDLRESIRQLIAIVMGE